MTSTIDVASGEQAFDFLLGSWNVRNRRLRTPFAGADDWDEFESRLAARPLPGGLGHEDLSCTDFDGGLIEMSFRFFDPESGIWSIYRVDGRRRGVLYPPLFGGLSDDAGLFLGQDMLEGRPILVRCRWSGVTTPRPCWEQAFSDDGGDTWETNWNMELARPEAEQ